MSQAPISKELLHNTLRKKLITLLYKAHSGHLGSSLSCLDVLIELMLFEMKKGDKFILSKGHAAPSLYITLNKLKKISSKELSTFHLDGTRLPAHTPNYHFSDDIPFATGSLGHGLSLASGIAHSYKYFVPEKSTNKIYCMISDGECNEGQVWEAAQYASAYKLSNLVVLLDKNNLQALGRIEDVLGDSATRAKWEAFGFEVIESDGHLTKSVETAFSKVEKSKLNRPKIIIFNTVKGRGISFMENTLESHYNVLSTSEYEQVMTDLNLHHEK